MLRIFNADRGEFDIRKRNVRSGLSEMENCETYLELILRFIMKMIFNRQNRILLWIIDFKRRMGFTGDGFKSQEERSKSGTSGLETRNRSCNQPPSPANSHSSDNQASVQAAANPRSINTTAKEICKSLITNEHIHISWIKAHVGYDGNEEADRSAKEAAESDRDPLSVKAPIFFLKSVFNKKKMMEDWQSDWEDEDMGRTIFDILPRVSTQPCYWKREEILFFTGHGPFPRT
ncbi:hypothetical protein AVEN_117190-1 [Araneus ventricosus]|uniref:RNase H type-1 domain-containing protein n=1 Tax=Araneus ventricosus TaxID=182803 RepID=A0A4Y2AZ17_ARAVE|nr:hypothetical protein AVEN_117190-1 [Araneus ventricosus]